MKLKTISILTVAIVVLSGCRGRNDPETMSINIKNENSPEFVADTPKGKLFRIWIDIGSDRNADRVYFFENNTNLTVNMTISNGKLHTQKLLC